MVTLCGCPCREMIPKGCNIKEHHKSSACGGDITSTTAAGGNYNNTSNNEYQVPSLDEKPTCPIANVCGIEDVATPAKCMRGIMST